MKTPMSSPDSKGDLHKGGNTSHEYTGAEQFCKQ